MIFKLINKETGKVIGEFRGINKLKIYLLINEIPYNLNNPRIQRELRDKGETETLCKKYKIKI